MDPVSCRSHPGADGAEIRPSRRRRGAGRRRPECCSRPATSMPPSIPLGGEGAARPCRWWRHGAADTARIDRCRDRPGLRLAFRRGGACPQAAASMLRKARARCRLHWNAAATGRSTRPPPGRWRPPAAPTLGAAQQLLGQAFRLHLSCLRPWRRPGRLCRAGPSHHAGGDRGTCRNHRRPARCQQYCRRWLLNSHLCHSIARLLAAGFARFATGQGMAPDRAAATQAHPGGGGGKSADGGRHRALRHAADVRPRRARLQQDRGGRRVLRRPARIRPWEWR